MAFTRPLKKTGLLLWKNGILLFRRPVWLAFEILVPLLLYVVILVLRGINPPEYYPDQLYRPMALPSAGVLPFAQTLICDLSLVNPNDSAEMPEFPDANVTKIYGLLGDTKFSELGTSFCSALTDVRTIGLCNNPLTSKLYNGSIQNVQFKELLSNEKSFRWFLSHDLHLNQSVINEILNATIKTNQAAGGFALLYLRSILGDGDLLQNLNGEQLRLLICEGPFINSFVSFSSPKAKKEVIRSLCNLTDDQFQMLAVELRDQLSNKCTDLFTPDTIKRLNLLFELVSLLPPLLDSENELTDSLGFSNIQEMYGYTHDFLCGSLPTVFPPLDLEILGSHLLFGDSYQRGLYESNLTQLPDRIAPKILYAPNTTVTRRIMEYANITFEAVQVLLDVLEQVDNCSGTFVASNPPDGELSDRIISYLDNPFVQSASGLSQEAINSLEQLFDVGSAGSIWNRTEELHRYVTLVEEYVNLVDWDIFYPTDSEENITQLSFDKDLQKEMGISTVFAGIVFNDDIDELPLKNVSIKIRMNSTYVHDTELLKEPVWFEGPEGDLIWKRRYLDGGFVFLQDMVERAAIDEIVGHRVTTPGGYLHQMPYHCFDDDLFLVGVQWLLPLTMSLGWMLSVAMIVRGVVREKETRMKETMRMMGLGRGQLWASWFITSFLTLLVSVMFITISLKYGGLLTHTSGLLLFLYLLTYSMAVIMYCFLVSLFFTNANLAACVAALAYFMFFFVQFVVLVKLSLLPVVAIMFMCLMLPVAFALGCTMMVQFELQLIGQQFWNMFDTIFPDNSFNFGMVFLMLWVDIFLYALVIWYVEAVFPGTYGVSKPWYFPIQPLIKWFNKKRNQKGKSITATGEEDQELLFDELGCGDDEEDSPICEDEPEGLVRGIRIFNLSKTYNVGCKKEVKALKKLNLNLYQGQITAFLGHNGAGKTTTMSLLTGLYEPTNGTATINNLDIRRDMDRIRDCLGMCPQHNVLFDNLTVEEHILFFAQMKGMGYNEAKQQLPMWLEKVDLNGSHAHKLAKRLSGGMKRKLSILLAFVGNPKTVILDEPTSGVDPYARTQIWDFVSQLKDGRTIMLSTHHMDEAVVLGDRIAIVSKGNLRCVGSFDFLKGRFGRGHHLTVVMDKKSLVIRDPSSGQEDDDVDGDELDSSNNITTYLKEHIPSAELVERGQRELNYLLPLKQSRPQVLKELLSGIDKQQAELGIVHYGITSCSMDEIFIDLTQKEFEDSVMVSSVPPTDGAFPQRTLFPRGSSASFDVPLDEIDGVEHDKKELVPTSEEMENGDENDVPAVSGLRLLLYQYFALLMKRFHYTRRNPLAFFFQNILPLFVIGGCLLIAYSVLNVYNPSSLLLHPSMYFKFTRENYIFTSQNDSDVSMDYLRTMYSPCGVGAKYLDNQADPNSMCYVNTPSDNCHNYPLTFGECTCRNCSRTPLDYLDFPTCYNGTITGSRLQNLSTYSYEELSSYLMATKRTFIEERYGGVSFGHRRSDVPDGVDEQYHEDINGTNPIIALQEGAKAWYSYKGYHAMPAFLNTMNNAILRANVPSTNSSSYGVTTYSHPFPTTVLQKLESAIEHAAFLINPLAAMFSLGFVVAGFVLVIVEERSSGFLHLQLVCGLDRLSYWLTMFTWDFISYTCVSVLILIMYSISQDDNFRGADLLLSVFTLFLSYGVAMIPWTYVYSFLFECPRIAYVVMFSLNLFSGLVLLLIDAIVVSLALNYDDSSFSYWLSAVPMPSYILARGIMYFTLDRVVDEVGDTVLQEGVAHPLTEIWPYILAMVLHGVIATVILVIIQLFQYKTSFNFKKSSILSPNNNEDTDVKEERERVANGTYNGCPLLLDNLTKVYGLSAGKCRKGPRRTAVNRLSLGLQQSECFGLLGLNGAGKTSTFKMITSDTKCTDGDAFINGTSVTKSGTSTRRNIGYCPQTNAFSESLTGREHLTLICRLRGIPPKHVKSTVDKALSRLELDQYSNKPVKTYSGGNMRRLSTAIALIGEPPVLLLDEPTSGVDPRARQFLWETIKSVAGTKHAVLLTTHNMAECETLCTRIGIMVNGELKCIGTPQELKSKFGKGYTLNVRVSNEHKQETKGFIERSFPSVILKDEYHNGLLYGLPPGLPLSSVYEAMESSRPQLDIEDYSLSQTTLDDVFIHFVKDQREESGILDHRKHHTSEVTAGTELVDTVSDCNVTASTKETTAL